MTRSPIVTIRRTGQAPLVLRDHGLVAQATSHTQQGARQNRWHEIELWADDTSPAGHDQPHVIVVRYVTQWAGELGHDWACELPRHQVSAALAAYDPTQRVTGYPPGAQYDERRARLLADIRAGYEHAVSDVLEVASSWEVGDA